MANPVALAIVGGFVTLMTGIATSTYTAAQNREAEAFRASYSRESARETFQADLIKKFVEGPSSNAVRENLKFLIDAKLIPSYAKEIQAYLAANPDTAPQVAAPSGRDEAVPADSLSSSDPLRPLSRSVGRVVSGDGRRNCTAFLVGIDLIVSAGHCVFQSGMFFVIGTNRIPARVVGRSDLGPADRLTPGKASFTLLRLASTPSPEILPLKLSDQPPSLGVPLSIVLFRGAAVRLAVESPNCVAEAVVGEVFEHYCKTGSSSSGAPIFSTESGMVEGLHVWRQVDSSGEDYAGWATRADVIAAAIEKLK